MFAGASAAEILPCDHNIAILDTVCKCRVESLEEVGKNFFWFRAVDFVGEVAGEHLVGVEVVGVGIIPHPVMAAVVSGGDGDGWGRFLAMGKVVITRGGRCDLSGQG